jgi:hypothetical protein
MGIKTWAIAGGLTLALFGAAVGLPAGAASAQSSRPQVPLFEPDPLWFEALPNRWVTGAIGGVSVDSHDNVWVFHRPASIADNERPRRSTHRAPSAVFLRHRSWSSAHG